MLAVSGPFGFALRAALRMTVFYWERGLWRGCSFLLPVGGFRLSVKGAWR